MLGKMGQGEEIWSVGEWREMEDQDASEEKDK